jgi:hypothetical protein
VETSEIIRDLYKQVKSESGLSWVQKEFLNHFIQTPSKQRQIIIETMLEYKRKGNFIRIYPSKNSDFYDCFISQNKQV